MRMNELQVQATMWMNLAKIMLNTRSKHKNTYCMNPFFFKLKKGKNLWCSRIRIVVTCTGSCDWEGSQRVFWGSLVFDQGIDEMDVFALSKFIKLYDVQLVNFSR